MTELSEHDVARIVESSEMRAYSQLIQSGSREHSDKHGLRAVTVGSAAAILAEGVGGTLNLNRVIGLGIAEPVHEAMLDAIDALYGRAGLSYAIELSPMARPETVRRSLRQRGFRAAMETAMFYRRATGTTPVETDLEVRRTGPADAAALAAICCESFHMPQPVADLLVATVEAPGWQHWIAFHDGEPSAAALCYIEPPLGWLGWDATRPIHRGRRAQQALIVARLNAAASAGCDYVTAETSIGTAEKPDPSYRNYERIGFTRAYSRRTYVAIRRSAPSPG